MTGKLWRALAVLIAGALFSGSMADGQILTPTKTSTPTRNFTPTTTPTSNRTADLSLTKVASPNPVGVGQELTYTLTVRNNGPSFVPNVFFNDQLPADVSLVSVSPPNCNPSCALGGMPSGFSTQVIIVVRPTKAGKITNSAEVASAATDPNPSNNTASVTTDVVEPTPTRTSTPTRTYTPTATPTSQGRIADLSLTKTASPNPVRVGEELTYTLTVHNNGPNIAPNGVSLTDHLPTDVVLVSVDVPPPVCGYGGGTVSCRFDFLGPGSSKQVVIVVKPTRVGQMTNSADVDSSTFDPHPANNRAAVTTRVIEGPPPSPPDPFAFLHGVGNVAHPVLSLDPVAPTGAAKYKDSAALRSGLTNSWVEVGTWSAQPEFFAGTLGELDDLHVWLGLKSSDDEGTQFDLRAEVWKNSLELVASGETACVQGVTRSPDRAQEAAVSFDLFPPVSFDGTTDVMSLKVSTRIAKTCSSHGAAIGLRLYFDSIARPSGLWNPGPAIHEVDSTE